MGNIFIAAWLLATPVLAVLLYRAEKKHKEAATVAAGLKERFQAVLDADIEAERILAAARSQGEVLVNGARAEAAALHEMNSDLKAAVDNVLKNARTEAHSLLKAARKMAGEMTADLGDKLQTVIDCEKAVQALRNKMEGYGDEYLLPPQSLLDELAENFGFNEAGQALKRAREHSRQLIKAGSAAVCHYAEETRRATAEAFVLDAFNGKIEAILARMKHDNAGKLFQEAKDAFALVNANGKAFRDAHITLEYLLARMEEIKWGAAALELREKAREEQRALKEQMREEERARREYEKALREAVKAEEKAAVALDKARLAYAQAETESARAKLEERIREFEEQLAQAKMKEAQAISMAQLTRSGHVYVLSNIGSFGEGTVKIGMTRRLEPLDRVKELGDASVPFPFDVHAIIRSDDAPKLEADLHRRFNLHRVNKVNYRKEFFKVTAEEVHTVAEEMGLEAHFTLLAEALEYKESRAIEGLPEAEQAALLANAVPTEEQRRRIDILGDDEQTEEAA